MKTKLLTLAIPLMTAPAFAADYECSNYEGASVIVAKKTITDYSNEISASPESFASDEVLVTYTSAEGETKSFDGNALDAPGKEKVISLNPQGVFELVWQYVPGQCTRLDCAPGSNKLMGKLHLPYQKANFVCEVL